MFNHIKPYASLSLDLDNQWSYMKTHGDSGWEDFPSYLPMVSPRILQILARRGLKITFFVVGQDAALEGNRAALRSLAQAGHEIGNHSFNHEPWLHHYTLQEVETELSRAEAAIQDATGHKPVGFRGPGFSVSPTVWRVLAQRGYQYDASTFPTYIGPLARLYYFMTARLKPEEKSRRDNLFGSVADGFRPIRAHLLPGAECAGLVEIPVTTMPIFKIPIHVSYVIYLAAYSRVLALTYFHFAMWLCRLTRTHPSLLLHPLDFLGCDDVRELSFFPGMNLPGQIKLDLVAQILDIYQSYFEVINLHQHAAHLAQVHAGQMPARHSTKK